jgi:hypothetical protein
LFFVLLFRGRKKGIFKVAFSDLGARRLGRWEEAKVRADAPFEFRSALRRSRKKGKENRAPKKWERKPRLERRPGMPDGFCFRTKNPDLGKFWRVLRWKTLVYFMSTWSTLRPLEILYWHLVNIVVVWYILPRFGMLYQEKSGSPIERQQTKRGGGPRRDSPLEAGGPTKLLRFASAQKKWLRMEAC